MEVSSSVIEISMTLKIAVTDHVKITTYLNCSTIDVKVF